MSSRRVILDSDDEEDENIDASRRCSPERAGGIAQPIVREMEKVPSVGDSSADPAILQAVYDEHFGGGLAQSHSSISLQLPVLEQPLVNSHTPSSASGGQRLKRSKTANLSSLTSISEHDASIRKAKRRSSARNVDELTQITTPRKSKDTTEPESWEFPSSSTSHKQSDLNGTTNQINAKKKKPIKTYSRPLRRSQTMAHTPNQAIYDQAILPIDGGLSPGSRDRLTRSSSLDDILPYLQSTKTQEVGFQPITGQHENISKEATRKTQLDGSSMDWKSAITDNPSTDVPTTMNYQLLNRKSNTLDAGIDTNVPLPSCQSSDDPITFNALSNGQKLRVNQSSIAVVPKHLTDDQKRQYDIVSVTSSTHSPRTSLPTAVAIHQDSTIALNCSTVLDTVLQPLLSLKPTHSPASPILFPSSPPIIKATQKRKRAGSDIDMDMAVSPDPSASMRTTKRKGRRKTIAPGERPSVFDTSGDEHSFMLTGSAQGRPQKRQLMSDKQKRVSQEEDGDDDEYLTEDDLSFDPNGQPGVQTQRRSGLRRLKRNASHASNDVVDDEPSISSPIRQKACENAKLNNTTGHGTMDAPPETEIQFSSIQPDSVTIDLAPENDEPELPILEIERSLPETTLDTKAHAHPPQNNPMPSTTPIIPPQPKRRGRKKTSEIAAGKTQSAKPVVIDHEALDIALTALEEIDCNAQCQQKQPSAPNTAKIGNTTTQHTPPKLARTVASVDDTPTKNPKKSAEQHSPLQSGKVPYRIGLSKRTRIAPLLKMIRK